MLGELLPWVSVVADGANERVSFKLLCFSYPYKPEISHVA